MLEPFDAKWHVLKLRNVQLVLFTLVISIAWKSNAQHSNLNPAKSIIASLRFHHASSLPSEGEKSDLSPHDDQADADLTLSATSYLALEDSLFFDKEKRDIEASKASPHHSGSIAVCLRFATSCVVCETKRPSPGPFLSHCRCARVAGSVQGAGRISWTW